MRAKSLGIALGLANAWPPGSTKFANAPPPWDGQGRQMAHSSRGVGGGGKGAWAQLELTDALS